MKNKIIAALFALLGGFFGLEYFYLGEKTEGILCVIFCWTGIPAIIGFFKGLSLLLRDQEYFDAEYNEGRNSNIIELLQGAKSGGMKSTSETERKSQKTTDDLPEF